MLLTNVVSRVAEISRRFSPHLIMSSIKLSSIKSYERLGGLFSMSEQTIH